MNWDDFVTSVLVIVIIALVVALFVGIGAVIDKATCTAKTADIGFPHRWGLFKGCQIEVNPNQWIPLESYYFRQGQ